MAPTVDQAIELLRQDPSNAEWIRDSYLDEDLVGAAARFEASDEFAAVVDFIGDRLKGGLLVDLGAGNGVASAALAHAGCRAVIALEPDPGVIVGRCAARQISSRDARVVVVAGIGEALPLRTASVDVVYARAVLHHIKPLPPVMREIVRVLRPGGLLLACREHVVDNDEQLARFLATHPVHQLTHGEGAHSLPTYLKSIRDAGLRLLQVLGPWDSIINAFPSVRTQEELAEIHRVLLERRLGTAGHLAARVPGVGPLVRRWLRSAHPPGRLYTFLAAKNQGR